MSEFSKKKWIENGLRRISYKYPPRYTTQTLARIERGKYRCSDCKGSFKVKEIQLDHIVPVIDPVKGFTDWNDYIERMFPDMGGYQVLCTECHQKKSESENVVRREKKKKT